MGGCSSSRSVEVPEGPLDSILSNWEKYGGKPMSRAKLFELCTSKWPRYQLKGGARWPAGCSPKREDVLKLQAYCRGRGKWDELVYASCFVMWCNDQGKGEAGEGGKAKVMPCVGIKMPPPVVCPEDDLLDLSPPPYPAPRPAPAQVAPLASPEEGGGEAFVPNISSKSLRPTSALLAPLREVVGPQGPTTLVHVPFTTSDLLNWKQSVGPFAENPAKVAELLRTIFVTHLPNWGDVMALLGTLMTGEERRRLLAIAQEEALQLAPEDQRNREALVPTANPPSWDVAREGEGRASLALFRQAILNALPKVYPKPLNLNKLYDVRQGKDENPSEFYERLCEAARTWTNLDPAAADNQKMVNVLFIGQAAPDIRLKLQKAEGGAGMPISQLIEIAYKAYHGREREREEEVEKKERKRAKAQAAVLAAAIVDRERETGSWGRDPRRFEGGRGRGQRRGGFVPQAGDQCRHCKKMGHWWRDCPERRETVSVGRGNVLYADSD